MNVEYVPVLILESALQLYVVTTIVTVFH